MFPDKTHTHNSHNHNVIDSYYFSEKNTPSPPINIILNLHNLFTKVKADPLMEIKHYYVFRYTLRYHLEREIILHITRRLVVSGNHATAVRSMQR